jgi:hypothetical protein
VHESSPCCCMHSAVMKWRHTRVTFSMDSRYPGCDTPASGSALLTCCWLTHRVRRGPPVRTWCGGGGHTARARRGSSTCVSIGWVVQAHDCLLQRCPRCDLLRPGQACRVHSSTAAAARSAHTHARANLQREVGKVHRFLEAALRGLAARRRLLQAHAVCERHAVRRRARGCAERLHGLQANARRRAHILDANRIRHHDAGVGVTLRGGAAAGAVQAA